MVAWVVLEERLKDALNQESGRLWRYSRGQGHDLVSDDGLSIIELKQRLSDRRSFISAATSLAIECRHQPSVGHAYLVLWAPRLALGTIAGRWHELIGVLEPAIAQRMRLVVVSDNDDMVFPDTKETRRLVEITRQAAGATQSRAPKVNRKYEVLKILVLREFLGQKPIRIRELQEQTGLSHPSVTTSLARLGKHIERMSDRSVRLYAFPHRAWEQLRALAPLIRNTAYYEDATGQPVDLTRLARRLRRLRPEWVAIGGVVAARNWQADFDLDGTPRLDLCVHAPDGRRDVSFIQSMDTALELTKDPARAVVAVHSLTRAETHFTERRGIGLVADPVETLLDLYDLRLDAQAHVFERAGYENEYDD